MSHLPMTVPLWTLATFVAWTLFVLALLLVTRTRHMSKGGSIKDFGRPDEEQILWRLFRAHSNCIENLPLFAGIVLILSIRSVGSDAIDGFSITYITARIAHSIVHIAGWHPGIRFSLLLIQIICLLTLLAMSIIT